MLVGGDREGKNLDCGLFVYEGALYLEKLSPAAIQHLLSPAGSSRGDDARPRGECRSLYWVRHRFTAAYIYYLVCVCRMVRKRKSLPRDSKGFEPIDQYLKEIEEDLNQKSSSGE